MRQLPKVYSQRDPSWASQRLGTVDGTTIGQYGCYTTSLSMLACYYGHTVTPAQLDDIFTNNPATNKPIYIDGNLCPDTALQQAFPECVYQKTYDYSNSPADLDILRDLLADPTISVVVEIDFDHNPNDGIQTHFVTVVDCDGSKVTIADPWYGSIDDFAKNYGNNPSQTILKFVIYKGTPVSISASNGGGNMFDLPSGSQVDLNNPASMKVCATTWDEVVNQKIYVTQAQYNADIKTKQDNVDILTGNVNKVTAAIDAIAVVLGLPTGSSSDDIIAKIKPLQTTTGTANDLESKAVDPTSGKLYRDLYTQLESDTNTPVTGLKARLTTCTNSNVQLKNTSYTTADTQKLVNELANRAFNKVFHK